MKEILQKYSENATTIDEIITEKNKFIIKKDTNELICAYSYKDELKTKVKHTYFYKEGTKYGEGHDNNITDKVDIFDYERIVSFDSLYEKWDHYKRMLDILNETEDRVNIIWDATRNISLHNFQQIYSYANNDFISDERNTRIIEYITECYTEKSNGDYGSEREQSNEAISYLRVVANGITAECFKVLALSLSQALTSDEYELCMQEIKDFIHNTSNIHNNQVISFMFDDIINLPKINHNYADIGYGYKLQVLHLYNLYVYYECDLTEFGIQKSEYPTRGDGVSDKYNYTSLNLLIDTVKNCTLFPIEL